MVIIGGNDGDLVGSKQGSTRAEMKDDGIKKIRSRRKKRGPDQTDEEKRIECLWWKENAGGEKESGGGEEANR